MAARRADTGEPGRHRCAVSSNEGNALAQSVRCPASVDRNSKGAAISAPRMYALVWPAYGAVVLAMDTRAGIGGQGIPQAQSASQRSSRTSSAFPKRSRPAPCRAR